MSRNALVLAALSILLESLLDVPHADFRASDPGVRGGDPGGGGPIAGLTDAERDLWLVGLRAFRRVEEVSGGLGPRFNLDNCFGCHSQPAIGGTSPAVNPQVAMITKFPGNVLPPFITEDGPAREARFVNDPDGNPDGGVAALFTITGHPDAAGCELRQPDFAGQLERRNVIFRIPTPVFGVGLIEAIPDATILENQTAELSRKRALGIAGRPGRTLSITGSPNRSGNDGTITRFGWKAQNKSLLVFAAEAYNVEMGVSNDGFPTEREEDTRCQFAPVPNDALTVTDTGIEVPDVSLFAFFMLTHAPPTPVLEFPGASADSILRGRQVFEEIGCALCHTPALRTGNHPIAALNDKQANLFSDLLLHNMGLGLADGVSQGNAGPEEFRTAPLWGLGQRIFFLHDGRTTDLMVAIREHGSGNEDGIRKSEANKVIKLFERLSEWDKQDLLNFLRSL